MRSGFHFYGEEKLSFFLPSIPRSCIRENFKTVSSSDQFGEVEKIIERNTFFIEIYHVTFYLLCFFLCICLELSTSENSFAM